MQSLPDWFQKPFWTMAQTALIFGVTKKLMSNWANLPDFPVKFAIRKNSSEPYPRGGRPTSTAPREEILEVFASFITGRDDPLVTAQAIASEQNKWLMTKEACTLFGASQTTFLKWVAENEVDVTFIQNPYVVDGNMRFLESSLIASFTTCAPADYDPVLLAHRVLKGEETYFNLKQTSLYTGSSERTLKKASRNELPFVLHPSSRKYSSRRYLVSGVTTWLEHKPLST